MQHNLFGKLWYWRTATAILFQAFYQHALACLTAATVNSVAEKHPLTIAWLLLEKCKAAPVLYIMEQSEAVVLSYNKL